MNVMGIGDSVIDCYADTRMVYPGGNSLNFSVFAASLGAQAEYRGIFGNDAAAAFLEKVISAVNVDCSYCERSEYPTNKCLVRLNNGDRTIYDNIEGDLFTITPITLDESDFERASLCDVVHTSFYARIDNCLERLRKCCGLLVYDFSVYWTEAMLNQVCKNIDVGFFSLGHFTEKDAVDFLFRVEEMGCNMVVGTLGKRGAMVVYNGKLFHKVAYKSEEAMHDTMGAGDSFLTGFMLCYAEGKNYLNKQKSLGLVLPLDDEEDYNRLMIEYSIARGNILACKNCTIDASFNMGIPYSELGIVDCI